MMEKIKLEKLGKFMKMLKRTDYLLALSPEISISNLIFIRIKDRMKFLGENYFLRTKNMNHCYMNEGDVVLFIITPKDKSIYVKQYVARKGYLTEVKLK